MQTLNTIDWILLGFVASGCEGCPYGGRDGASCRKREEERS